MFLAYNMLFWDGLYYDYVQIAATIRTPKRYFLCSQNHDDGDTPLSQLVDSLTTSCVVRLHSNPIRCKEGIRQDGRVTSLEV